jgi:predicted patatin/cPLA2 family phospholipase
MKLVEANLNTFAVRYGASGGGINFAASIAHPRALASVFDVYRHLVEGGHIGFQCDYVGRMKVVFNIDELFHVLQGRRTELGLPALDAERVRVDPAPFRVAVTDRKTGRGRFLDVKRDVFKRLRATAAIQGACDPVKENGREVGDGDVDKPIGPGFARLAKHVLVILNRPPIEERTWWEQVLAPMITRLVLANETHELRETAANMDWTFSKRLKRLMHSKKVRTLVLYPDLADDLFSLTGYVPSMARAMETARNDMERLLVRAHAM